MNFFGYELQIRRATRSASIENPSVPVSSERFVEFFSNGAGVSEVTIERALTVPAVLCAVQFISRTLASVPLQAFRRVDGVQQRLSGKLQVILEENPNPEMDITKFLRHFWQQVMTGGRAFAWIERNGASIEAIWPMDPTRVHVERRGFKLFYTFEGRTYPASDVIDIAFMDRADFVRHYGPIGRGADTIALSLAMTVYGKQFFAGGGVPPLAVTGPMPANADAMRRAMDDISRAIAAARASGRPLFNLPPGYEIKQIGFDPEKGQMTDSNVFQVQQIARLYQLPPNFLHDLSRATFSNVEQNDLHLVKHLIHQWCKALEGELNLKLFGRMNGRRYVRHDLDGLMRGDFRSRIEGLARAVQGSIYTPNEAREREGLPPSSAPTADELHMQGATVPLGTAQVAGTEASRTDGADEAADEGGLE